MCVEPDISPCSACRESTSKAYPLPNAGAVLWLDRDTVSAFWACRPLNPLRASNPLRTSGTGCAPWNGEVKHGVVVVAGVCDSGVSSGGPGCHRADRYSRRGPAGSGVAYLPRRPYWTNRALNSLFSLRSGGAGFTDGTSRALVALYALRTFRSLRPLQVGPVRPRSVGVLPAKFCAAPFVVGGGAAGPLSAVEPVATGYALEPPFALLAFFAFRAKEHPASGVGHGRVTCARPRFVADNVISPDHHPDGAAVSDEVKILVSCAGVPRALVDRASGTDINFGLSHFYLAFVLR